MTLRPDLFKTQDRERTTHIVVRDTLTRNDPEIDAKFIDKLACKQGRLGIGYHFLINTHGDVELCRAYTAIGSHSFHYDQKSVAIGVVGGKDDAGLKAYTRTPDQEQAIAHLVELLKLIFPDIAEVHDTPNGITPPL